MEYLLVEKEWLGFVPLIIVLPTCNLSDCIEIILDLSYWQSKGRISTLVSVLNHGVMRVGFSVAKSPKLSFPLTGVISGHTESIHSWMEISYAIL